jgi:hypothetical protein
MPGIYSLGVVSLLHLFTIIDVIALLDLMNFKIKIFSSTTVFVFSLLALFLNYLFFFIKNTPKSIFQKIELLSASKINQLNVFMWIHIFITVGLFILLINFPI